ncbi:MAG: DNA polymerase III subunit alpha [Chitinispirillales bacterium]|jgi:DNA polymerase-3 subunit alpha|nr:DNA polymerase III subunit alpha [Chitinispirillales bacterium]
MGANFVSLHNHTEYSFLDGAIRIKDMVRRAKEFDMPAVAIMDHGGLFGAVEFYEVCKKEKIKPVIGFEAYIAPGSRLEKNPNQQGERNYSHLVLMAENDIGWKNLMRLSTIGYLEGFYHKPRIDMEVLRKYSKGIIATSACAAGAIPRAIIDGNVDKARKITEEYIDIFGKENFYFELQDHGIEEEKIAMEGLIKLGREMNMPFIVANDAHYLRHEDAASHEVLLCIGTQDTMDNPKRFRFSSDQIYFKSPDEMAKLFPDIPEAMTNTVVIAERCDVNITKKAQLPSIEVPKEFETPENHLSHLAKQGITEKYKEVTPELEERLSYELSIINSMGFASYFLIVRDFVLAAKNMGIMVGCRGSAAGSLAAYVIGITDVDPIKYDLIFERFLNPERISMPDADIDFADRDRYKVIDYVIEKYGREAVCQIINFGTMKAKAAVKDVARVMNVPIGESNKLTKMITESTLKDSLSANRELADMVKSSEVYGEVFRHAAVLEGLTRQPGMHAGGLIIAPGEVADWAPLFKQSNSDIIMTQFDMTYVENVGLVKMDLLGLRTLTVLQEALRLIKKYHNKEIDLWKLPEDDQKTLKLYGNGETSGIFQFESGGMKEYLRKLKPTCIEDIIAMVALYRPGPMDNINMFINRKHGKEKIEYPHPILEDILNVTYGVIIYQEQVMRISQVMGGFTLGSADVLRRAMGKKQVDMMEEMGKEFIEGAVAQKIDKKIAKEVFDLMAKFAGYGFNKAHAAVYAHLSYQTAYLKAHYPLEYTTAYLIAYLGDMEEFSKMRNEAEKAGIRMLPPDVNKSDYEFTIEDGNIRIGIAAVKNVGKAAESILAAREEKKRFTSIFDLCKSTDNRIVNKRALESLICAGALDGLGGTRAQHFEAVAKALEYGSSCQKDRDSDQVNMFDTMFASGDDGVGIISAPEPPLPNIMPWPLGEQLNKEKEILGFYISGHPLDNYADEVRAFADVNLADEQFKETPDGSTATICGTITSHKPITIQKAGKNKGRQMATMVLESFDASIKLVAFPDTYEKNRDLLTNDSMILIHGTIINREGNNPEIEVKSCAHLSQTRLTMTKSVHVRIPSTEADEKLMMEIYNNCSAHPGDCYLIIHLTDANRNKRKIRAGNISMSPSREIIAKLREMLGKENVWLSKANS